MSLSPTMKRRTALFALAALVAQFSPSVVAEDERNPAEAPTEPGAVATQIRPVQEMRQPRAVTALALDTSGRTMLTGGLDGAVRRWNVEGGTLENTWRLHDGDVGDVIYIADTGTALSIGVDGQLISFDPRSGKVRQRRQFATWCLGLTRISAELAAVACADLVLHVVEIASLRTVRSLTLKGDVQYGNPRHLSTSADGTMLLVGDPFSTIDIATWDVSPARRLFSYNAVLSPDGRYLLSGQIGRNAQLFRLDPFAQVGELRAPMEATVMSSKGRTVAVQDTPIYAVGWSTDGSFAATGGLDRLVRVWDMRDAERPVELARLAGHSDVVTQLAWLPDGKLVTSDLSGTILVWDPKSGLW